MHPDAATDVWRTEMLPTRLPSGRRPFTVLPCLDTSCGTVPACATSMV